jgi:membrane associated rhomboid family serine protease
MNIGMLAAFGAMAEKVYGPKPFIAFYICAGLMGALGHLIVEPFSQIPVVGASGALSGLFAVVIVFLQRMGQMGQGKYGLWPIIGIWCGISFLFAWAGGAGVGDIAWAAHLGGFLGGFALLRLPYFRI